MGLCFRGSCRFSRWAAGTNRPVYKTGIRRCFMNTQLSLLVKPESVASKYARGSNLLAGGGFAMFKNPGVMMILDGGQQILKPNKKPYIFNIAPGQHTLRLIDPESNTKKMGKKMTAGLLSATFGLANGSLAQAFVFGNASAASSFNTVYEDGTMDFTIGEGDILKLNCQATVKGVVRILPADK